MMNQVRYKSKCSAVRPSRAPSLLALALVVALGATAACSDSDDDEALDPTETTMTTVTTTTTTTAPTPSTVDEPRQNVVAVAGTTLAVTRQGSGPPLLLVHGGGEDAAMLAGQAAAFADMGFEAVTYDRRGTGGSGRDDWPGRGADQHADDAAALLEALDIGPATIVGVSSGGVVALDLAVRHPETVERVVAWEPPAAGVIPGGDEATAQIMAPVDAHLAEHPGDFVGAQAILLTAIVGFPVAADDPAFAAARANAEPMVRDEPAITLARFEPGAFDGVDVTIAVGSAPNDLIAAAVAELETLTGRPAVHLDGDHEVYLFDPSALAALVADVAAA
jgi:pimeloyl-ACP methyl ester carboxylesterase